MAYEQMLAPVLEKQALAKNIYRMVLQCRSIAQKAEPGQFVHLLPTGCTLRRPISICEINKSAGTLTIVFEVKGSGTDALANVRVGENLDILGPLGHGFTILPDAKHVVVVGGGIGNPPMLSLAQIYGARATAICGFRSANIVTLQDHFPQSRFTFLDSKQHSAIPQQARQVPASGRLPEDIRADRRTIPEAPFLYPHYRSSGFSGYQSDISSTSNRAT